MSPKCDIEIDYMNIRGIAKWHHKKVVILHCIKTNPMKCSVFQNDIVRINCSKGDHLEMYGG